MNFIVDESTGAAVVTFLRTAGHDVLAVAEDMPQANDRDILARAVQDHRVLVTNDKDFGELVVRSGQPHRGVLLLRPRDESSTSRIAVMQAVLNQWADQLIDHFVVATQAGVRIRPSKT